MTFARRLVLLGVLGALVAMAGAAAPAGADEDAGAAPTPLAPPPDPESAREVEPPLAMGERVAITRAAIRRGVVYLLDHQKADGSWGSAASNLWDIYAPPPGSQQAFQVASAALAVSGLLETGERGVDDDAGRARLAEAIRKGADFLLARHAVRRIRADTLYNTWALAYALEAFGRLLAREPAGERRTAYREAAEHCIDLLKRFEFVEGGWGYYNFDAMTRRPGPGSTSFTTATVLHAMKLVQDQGVTVPERLTERGRRIIRLSWRPDNAFYYSPDHRLPGATMGVNKVKGSLARTPACLLALDEWGEPIPAKRWNKAFDDLETYGHFLRIARKYPIPHETWYQNSGYFCLYGYYYAAQALSRLPPERAREHAAHIAFHVRGMQEADGSTWDYQLFQFHKAYGTGYALLALDGALDVLEAPVDVAATPDR